MMFRDTPIQRKLMIVLLLTCGTVLLVTCAAFTAYEVITLRKGMVQGYTTRAEILAANSSAALAFQDEADATSVLSALKSDPRTVAAGIYDKNNQLFARFPADAPAGDFPSDSVKAGHRFESDSLVVFSSVVQGGRTLGTVYIKADLTALTDRYQAFLLLATVILVGSLLMAYFISKALQKQISQPILSLARTAQAISDRRDYSVRATKLGDDELGALTDAFNQMLTQIQEQNQTLQASETEVRQLNTTLEQRVHERTSQLEAANKELEAFSYSVSHDLRAPLRHIGGFTDMLQQNSAAKLDEAGQRYLGIISNSAKQMGALIDDLLVFSRLGRSELRRSTLNMDKLVAEVQREMAEDFVGRNIIWNIGLLPEVYGDRALLKQVWVNLLSNAVKYSRHREPATIRVSCQQTDRSEWEFSVADNGAGFDMQYVGKLFGVFQRLHLAEEFEGTGIGLANVQRIVLRHGGRVWAEGKIDSGATFYFTLPIIGENKT